jgi:hypothetical protein
MVPELMMVKIPSQSSKCSKKSRVADGVPVVELRARIVSKREVAKTKDIHRQVHPEAGPVQ